MINEIPEADANKLYEIMSNKNYHFGFDDFFEIYCKHDEIEEKRKEAINDLDCEFFDHTVKLNILLEKLLQQKRNRMSLRIINSDKPVKRSYLI